MSSMCEYFSWRWNWRQKQQGGEYDKYAHHHALDTPSALLAFCKENLLIIGETRSSNADL